MHNDTIPDLNDTIPGLKMIRVNKYLLLLSNDLKTSSITTKAKILLQFSSSLAKGCEIYEK